MSPKTNSAHNALVPRGGKAGPSSAAASRSCAQPSAIPPAKSRTFSRQQDTFATTTASRSCDAETRDAWAVRIAHISVKPDRMIAQVEIAHERYAMSNLTLIKAVVRAYPTILEHTCVNGKGDTFTAVACNTSIPHVLEHMVIDAQVRAASRGAGGASGELPAAAAFVGKTAWMNRSHSKARVEVSFADDLVALRAFRDAADFLNFIMLK